MLSTVLPRLAASLHHWRRIARRLAWPQMLGPTLWAEHVVQQQLFHLSEDVRSRVFCKCFAFKELYIILELCRYQCVLPVVSQSLPLTDLKSDLIGNRLISQHPKL